MLVSFVKFLCIFLRQLQLSTCFLHHMFFFCSPLVFKARVFYTYSLFKSGYLKLCLAQFSILEVVFPLYIMDYQRKYFCSFASFLSIFVGNLFILIS